MIKDVRGIKHGSTHTITLAFENFLQIKLKYYINEKKNIQKISVIRCVFFFVI